ncbi:MAG: hypothetical protein RBS88_13380 [Spongiibacteraceae bacterium]|jgi:hypothetical protein|nr:hypothetical protein [Spongiibacteraceae bacterium]
MRNALPPQHTREQLYEVLDEYLAALVARDHTRVRWAPFVRNTENNVELMIGDGLWGTIAGLGSYDLRFADVTTGQVGYFGVVDETHEHCAFSLRLGVVNGAIAEVETLVVRQLDAGLKFEPQVFEHKPVLNEMLPPEQQLPRERLISIADGYFDTLQLNDGQLFTRFHPDCKRVENGVQTNSNPDFITPVAALSCEQQFLLGNFRYDDRLRGRRYPLVDVERGLVLAGVFIDHSGRLGDYELTDGTKATAPIRRPHTFYMLELFKIKNQMLEQIEANFITVPYHMPSPWDKP